MGDTVNNEQTAKKSFFKGLKAEFKKVVWPARDTVGKQTVAVVVVSVALGIMIAILDFAMKYGIEQFLKLG